jgi:GAF domain-containing protein
MSTPGQHDRPRTGPADSQLGQSVESAVARVPQLLQSGVPRQEILAQLVMTAESVAGPGATSSILALDERGLLRNAASPNLPADYLAAIDGLKPDPMVGTCAAAAATGCVVVTADFRADDKWAELRHLPLALGFVGAWSMPIKSGDGTILGTFGTYFREFHQPSDVERHAVERLATAAALVLASR